MIGPEDKQSGEEGGEVCVCVFVHLFTVALQNCVNSDAKIRTKSSSSSRSAGSEPCFCSWTCAEMEKDKREQSC